MKQQTRIFFIYPPKIENQKDINFMPPIDMMIMSSIAKNRGYDTRFKDYNLDNSTVYDFLRDIRIYKPDFLVVNVNSSCIEEELTVLTQAGNLLKDTIVIAKGGKFNFNSCSIMQKYPEIDIALKENQYRAFDEIISYKNLNDIKNIIYQVKNKIVCTPKRKEEKNINWLPYIDINLDGAVLNTIPNYKKDALPVVFSLNKKYKDAKLVLEEIKDSINKTKLKNYILCCDNFFYDKNKAKELLNLIIKDRLKINFIVNINVISVNFEDIQLIKMLKKAGCSLVLLDIKFDISKDSIKKIVKTFKKTGIQVELNYINGSLNGGLNDRYSLAREKEILK